MREEKGGKDILPPKGSDVCECSEGGLRGTRSGREFVWCARQLYGVRSSVWCAERCSYRLEPRSRSLEARDRPWLLSLHGGDRERDLCARVCVCVCARARVRARVCESGRIGQSARAKRERVKNVSNSQRRPEVWVCVGSCDVNTSAFRCDVPVLTDRRQCSPMLAVTTASLCQPRFAHVVGCHGRRLSA
jgi:hypothetical protein